MRIAAHRGHRLHAPENSRAGLISAYTAGADVLEFDLQLTKDGQLVLSHDPTTERLTGQPGRIIDLTLAELRKLEPQGAGNEGYGHNHGSLRAGADPGKSVLDTNCQSHTVHGLYVLDSAFMPTAGASNPTLTQIANAYRVCHSI